MAYKLNTEKMSGWGTTRPNTGKDTSATSTQLGVYINDNIYNQKYIDNIAADNPVYDAMSGDNCGVEGKQVQTHINIYHTCDLIVCGADGIENDGVSWNPSAVGGNAEWGNWRTADGIKVNEHVLLRPDNTKIQFSSEQSFEGMWDKIMGNPLLDGFNKIASGARMAAIAFGADGAKDSIDTRGIFLSQYQEIPTLSKISTLKMPSQIKFEFQFGQAGLFSAEEEVVKPVLALAKCFMPVKGSGKASNKVFGNAPSGEYFLNTLILSAFSSDGFGKVGKALSDLKWEDYSGGTSGIFNGLDGIAKSGQNLLSNGAIALTQIQNSLYDALDGAAADVLSGAAAAKQGLTTKDELQGTAYKCVRYRIGRFVFPRLLVKSVTLDFDFSVLDEYGFPYKGSVELGGLESIVLANRDMLRL